MITALANTGRKEVSLSFVLVLVFGFDVSFITILVSLLIPQGKIHKKLIRFL